MTVFDINFTKNLSRNFYLRANVRLCNIYDKNVVL